MADNADWRARPAGNAPKTGGTRWSSGGSGGSLGKGGKSSSKRGGKKKYVSQADRPVAAVKRLPKSCPLTRILSSSRM